MLKEVLPNVKDVRKGPDTNGADVEVELEIPIGLGGQSIKEKWAVQVKCYENEIDYLRAIEDIRKAFKSDETYTRGMIITTASEMTQNFERALEQLRNDSKKDVLVLYR